MEQQDSEMAALQDKLRSAETQHAMDLAVLQEKLTSAESEHRNLIRENDLLKSRISALRDQQHKFVREKEQSKSEKATLKSNMKSDGAVLSEKHKHDTPGIQAIFDQVSKENTDLKGAIAKSLADAESAKTEQVKQVESLEDELGNKSQEMSERYADKAVTRIKAKQANDDRVFNLILKRKQLQDAGISDSVIDEQLPLPGMDEDEPPSKKRRLVVCKEEELE
jgi:hypothetical protein